MSGTDYLFKIDVVLDEMIEVKGNDSSACMILFHGSMESDFFIGEILPGGVDTQITLDGGKRSLSARYVLKGHDADKNDCSIFVENNGIVEPGKEMVTTPRFITDSPSLKWIEKDKFTGRVVGKGEGKIEIRFYKR